jgi:hypothetical protein
MGVFDLHETPMVGLGEDVEHRTALLGIVIEDAMQVVGREGVGEGLRALPGAAFDLRPRSAAHSQVVAATWLSSTIL